MLLIELVYAVYQKHRSSYLGLVGVFVQQQLNLAARNAEGGCALALAPGFLPAQSVAVEGQRSLKILGWLIDELQFHAALLSCALLEQVYNVFCKHKSFMS